MSERPDPADDVPRLPRGRGLRLSQPQLVRIGGTLLLLAFVIIAQRPCADSVSKLVTGFGSGSGSSSALPRPGTIDVPSTSLALPGEAALPNGSAGLSTGGGQGSDLSGYEQLRPGMTDAEIEAAIARARAKAHAAGSGSAGSGSADSGSTGSGSTGSGSSSGSASSSGAR